MGNQTANHDNIREYLLGSLSEEIRQQIEEQLLTEDGFFEELLLSEEELINDYVNDELSNDNRLKFEQHFLSTPERHRKLRFALAFRRYAANSAGKAGSEADRKTAADQFAVSSDEPSWTERFRAFWSGQAWGLRAAMALSVAVLIAAALWFSLIRTPSPRTFATLNLTISNSTRAEGVQAGTVKLPLNADALRISLTLPEQTTAATTRYRVELIDDNGETKALEIAEQDAQKVSVVIPAAQLTRGQYALKLFRTDASGTEQPINGSYFFNVE